MSEARAAEWLGREHPDERLDDLLAAIRHARVGGSFWAPPLSLPAVARIVRPRSRDEATDAVARALAACDPATVLAILPDLAWSRRAAASLRRRGVGTTIGTIDPWSVVRPGVTVDAHPGDDYAILASIVGAANCHPDAGDAGDRRRALHRAIRAGVRYRDPFTGDASTVDDAIALLGAWRRTLDGNRDIVAATGIAWWKRRAITRFLWAGRARPLRFARTASSAVAAARGVGAVAVWPSRAPARLHQRAAAAAVPVVTIEDGFIRSIGLGSDLLPPLSIVVDRRGAHYDPSRPSDLETLLAESVFPDPLLARAEALIAGILRERISKYGVGDRAGTDEARGPRRRVLVTGQVEDDQSVLLGGGGVAGNIDLLARARIAEPDAEIWFRPHPDVEAGHRRGAVPDRDALRHADRVVRGGSMTALLDRVDGVHVLTSLAGFEALLRGRDVTTHGQPFYAGWGLTRDLAPPIARRTRRLTLAQLVAATLILYPRYLDPVTGLPCPPEVVVRRFAARLPARPSWLTRVRRIEGRMRRSLRVSPA